MRRQEMPNYTREQIVEHLRDALDVLSECEVPAELAPAALPVVFNHLAAKQITLEQIAPDLGRLAVPLR